MTVMPAIFFGHGNPLERAASQSVHGALVGDWKHTPATQGYCVCFSTRYVSGAAVTINTAPRTIHDFGGFPSELYDVQYPAPGDREFARRIQKLLAPCHLTSTSVWD